MFADPVTKAADALRKLRDARTALEGKAKAAEEELAALRAGAGEAELSSILDGSDSGPKTRARIGELTELLTSLSGARSALLVRIGTASAALQHAHAEEVRAEAKTLQKRLDAHLAEARKLRDALEKHENCPFVVKAEADQQFFASHPNVAPPHNLALKWPTSLRLAQEIQAMLRRAAAMEQARAEDRGQATGADLAELLAAIGENPLAPSAEEIKSTVAEMEAAAVAAWARHITGDFSLGTGPRPDERVTTFTIAWCDGRIDRQHSAWQNSRRPERFDANKPPVSKPAAAGAATDEAMTEALRW